MKNTMISPEVVLSRIVSSKVNAVFGAISKVFSRARNADNISEEAKQIMIDYAILNKLPIFNGKCSPTTGDFHKIFIMLGRNNRDSQSHECRALPSTTTLKFIEGKESQLISQTEIMTHLENQLIEELTAGLSSMEKVFFTGCRDASMMYLFSKRKLNVDPAASVAELCVKAVESHIYSGEEMQACSKKKLISDLYEAVCSYYKIPLWTQNDDVRYISPMICVKLLAEQLCYDEDSLFDLLGSNYSLFFEKPNIAEWFNQSADKFSKSVIPNTLDRVMQGMYFPEIMKQIKAFNPTTPSVQYWDEYFEIILKAKTSMVNRFTSIYANKY